MTSKNLTCKQEAFLLDPVGKDYLWGGKRLTEDFSKCPDITPLAETWECSTHPEGLSLVRSGSYRGQTLRDVLQSHPELAGKSLLPNGELPILIKLIDAKKDLSLQVHPDDSYAFQNENGSLGKSEMWYVLDAAPQTRLIYGFNRDIDTDTLENQLKNDSIQKYLQYVPVQKDDVFYIEPGQVHALGAGALVAEIQENSNITYRLYDYGRLDSNGMPRTLHIKKALEVVNLHGSEKPRQPIRVLRYQKGGACEFLCRCKYFQVERILIHTESIEQEVCYRSSPHSFQVLLCVEGQGELRSPSNLTFSRGDCIFIPAGTENISLNGTAQLLKVCC